MPRRKVYTQTFQEGLSTTGLEDGLRLPRWSVFQNIRLSEGPAKRRLGTQLIDSTSSPHTALDLTAASSHRILVPQYDTAMALTPDDVWFRTLCIFGIDRVVPVGVTVAPTVNGNSLDVPFCIKPAT